MSAKEERAGELAKLGRLHGVALDDEDTCEALQEELESLQEALRTAPTGHKAALVKAIRAVHARMNANGC